MVAEALTGRLVVPVVAPVVVLAIEPAVAPEAAAAVVPAAVSAAFPAAFPADLPEPVVWVAAAMVLVAEEKEIPVLAIAASAVVVIGTMVYHSQVSLGNQPTPTPIHESVRHLQNPRHVTEYL